MFGTGKEVPAQLFDLTQDEDEMVNIASSRPDLVQVRENRERAGERKKREREREVCVREGRAKSALFERIIWS